MPQLYKNNVSGVLAIPLSAANTNMVLLDASAFPAPTYGDFYLASLIGLNSNGQESQWEIVKVTAKAANTLTIVRAQEATTAAEWPAATTVQMRMTAGSFDTLAFDIASKAGLTGEGTSGTWPISVTGNAASASAVAWTGVTGKPAVIASGADATAARAAIGAEPSISAGTTSQYRRGDKTWQSLNKSAVGLDNVDNTSDANKPISTATQTALDATVKHLDVGASPAQVPAGQHLGKLAYMDELAALRATLTQPQAIGAVWVERVSDTSIKLFMRGSDGVARSTTLTLS